MINISIKKPKPVLVMVHNASKGLRGVGLSGVTLDKNGNLIFTMSDGTVKTIKGYSQNLINTTNAVNKIKEEVSTMANNAADSAKKAKETADSIKQEYDRVEGATNSGLALIERSVLYGINRVKEATKTCKSDALANIELAHKDAIDDIAIRRLEALQDISETLGGKLGYFNEVSVDNDTLTFRRGSGDTHRLTIDYVQHAHNASSATKLANARTINVQDASASNTGTGASFDGSGNATIKLPAKIKATLTGNADTATKATNDGNGNNIARTYLPLSGGTMAGDINMHRHNLIGGQSTNTGIYCAGNDNGGTLGTTGANINIKSWYGVGFINGLRDSDTYNMVTVGIDVRKGIVHATSFDGNAASATKATNDGNGNNIASTYLPLSGGTLTGVVNGVTPPNGDNSKKLATTEFVNAKASTYLPLSGGTLTGVVNGVTPPNGDNSKKLATTEFVNAKARNYLPLTGGTMTGSIQYVNNGKVFAIGSTGPGNNVNLGWTWNNRAGAGIGLRSVDYESPGEFTLFARDSANSSSLVGKPDGTLTWDGKNILTAANYNSYALPLSGGTLTGVVNGVTPTAGDNSTKLATTAFVNAKAGNYLPLAGGTLTGVVNGVTPPNGDNSKKLATTEFVNAKARNYLPLSGGTVTGGLTVEGTITGNLAGNADTATNATNDANGNPIAGTYLPLSGGTMSGAIRYVGNGKVFAIGSTGPGNNVNLGWTWNNRAGAGIGLRSVDYESPGEFSLYARDSANSYSLVGKPDGTLTWNNQPLLPVGIVQAFAGTTIPRGWLLCDGSAVSRTDYAALFAVIGTTYGAGNGSTTFNLPNLTDKFIQGSATSGTEKSAGLPNIEGRFVFHGGEKPSVISSTTTGTIGSSDPDPANAFYGEGGSETQYRTPSDLKVKNGAGSYGEIHFSASRHNSVYGNSITVQPPALTMRYIIKY